MSRISYARLKTMSSAIVSIIEDLRENWRDYKFQIAVAAVGFVIFVTAVSAGSSGSKAQANQPTYNENEIANLRYEKIFLDLGISDLTTEENLKTPMEIRFYDGLAVHNVGFKVLGHQLALVEDKPKEILVPRSGWVKN